MNVSAAACSLHGSSAAWKTTMFKGKTISRQVIRKNLTEQRCKYLQAEA